MKNVVFYLKEFHIGGAQLLILRLAKKFVELGYSATIIGIFEDENIFKEIKKANINAITIEDWENDRIARKIIKNICDSSSVVTMNWQDYCRILYLKGNSRHVIFYAVHRNDLITAAKNRIKMVEFINKIIVTKAIKELIDRKTIVAIDEDTVEASQNFYCFSENVAKTFKILRIAIDDDENTYPVSLKFEDNALRVLAIARADFPFKGYLMGMIDCMKPGILPSNTILEIVSVGKDQEKLEKKVEECSDEIRDRIKLYGKLNYKELEVLYKRSKVFVGMGTALLDAARYGTISVPVAAYTYDVESKGFFHDDCRRIVVKEGSLEDFKCCIEWVERLSREEYAFYYDKNKELIRENYHVDKIACELVDILNGCANNDDLLRRCKLSYLFSKMIMTVKRQFCFTRNVEPNCCTSHG